MTISGHRASSAWLVVGTALAGIYFAFPSGGTAQTVIYELPGCVAVLAMLWAVREHRPARPWPWLLFALGNACFVIGDVIFDIESNPPVPSWADGFYLIGYPLLVAGMLILMLSAGGRTRMAALGDAGVVAFGFAVFQWVFVMGPAVRSSGAALDHRIVSALYPAMDILLLAGFVGFFVSPAWQTTSFRYLLGAIAALGVGDEISGLAGYSYMPGSLVDLTWMLSYVLFAVAALHPSMRELSSPRRVPALRVSSWRMAFVGGALLTGPVVLLVQQLRGGRLDVLEVVALEAAVCLLVVARLTGIVRALERFRGRERDARAFAEQAQEQLAMRNAELMEADRLKDEFVALISHDLRTPLTSIIGYVELALDESVDPPLDDERRGYLGVVTRSSERLLRLVDDLLFVARLQSGNLDLEPTALDLAHTAAQSVDELRPRAERNGVALSFLGDEEVPIEADRGRVFQLLDNLISNAIKFTPSGGRVEVRTSSTPTRAVLEVIDTGIGLSPEDTERIFERFFRSEHAAERQIQGTGLGLFISRAIAEAHGGTITASSELGTGTTFRIELPTRVLRRPGENAAEMVT